MGWGTADGKVHSGRRRATVVGVGGGVVVVGLFCLVEEEKAALESGHGGGLAGGFKCGVGVKWFGDYIFSVSVCGGA